MAGLYDDTPGLSDGTGLWRGRLGLFSGASGFINGSGGAYVDLYFSAGTYSVAGNGYTTLGSIPGFTFTRASLAMGYDATGKLTYGPNNLCLQSQTFGTTWATVGASVTSDATTAPDGSTTADLINEDAATSGHGLDQGVTVPVGPVIFSFYVKYAARQWVRIDPYGGASPGTDSVWFDVQNGIKGTQQANCTGTITAVGGGWYRLTWAATVTAGTLTLSIRGASADNNSSNYAGLNGPAYYLWGAQLEAVTYQTTPSTYYPTTSAAYYGPRLVYDPVTLASLGILVEEARTNLALQSQTFGTTWTQTNVTVGDNITTSPDGTTNADSLIETAAAGVNHRVTQSVTTTAVATTFSCYLRAGSRSWAFLRMSNSVPANCFAWVNLATGVLGTVSGTGATATVQSVGNGWYRLALTVATAVAGANTIVVAGSTGDNVQDYDGTNGLTAIYAFGAQVELGQGASSPIPTTTASVTRAADAPILSGLSTGSALSVLIDCIIPDRDGQDLRMGALSVAAASADRLLFQRTTANAARIQSSVAASTAYLADLAGQTGSRQIKLGVSYGSAYASRINGAAPSVTVDTGTAPATKDTLQVGFNTTSYINGTISRIRIYNRALSDAELQAITQSLLLQEDGYSILQEDNSYIWLE